MEDSQPSQFVKQRNLAEIPDYLDDVKSPKTVLIATVLLEIQDKYGSWRLCRAILDSASDCNFITEQLRKSLHIAGEKTFIDITGFNLQKSTINRKISTVIKSRLGDHQEELEFLVTQKITNQIPDPDIFVENFDSINVPLADPTFNKKGKVDILLGAEIFFTIMENGKLDAVNGKPLLKETKFGWIAAGKIYRSSPLSNINRTMVADSLDEELKRMWSLDKCEYKKDLLSTEEKLCEQHFVNNVTRDSSGRFIVKIPFKENRAQLGDSYWLANKRFSYLQKKFEKHPEIAKLYSEFIEEYKSLNHLEEVIENAEVVDPTRVQYLPHHCIMRDSSSTTKLRVVFDGSALTKTGLSLNDTQMVGAKQQLDLFEILLRFCNHKYAMTADIKQMFRQILIHPDECDLQRIIWMVKSQLKIYRLKTVTYGTASAPFLATRVLKQLAIEEKDFPVASKVASKDFYMDDLMTGTDTKEEAIELQREMIALMNCGGFHLHKWCANDTDILENIDENLREKQVLINQEETVKTLGMRWIPLEDCFTYKIDEIPPQKIHTKRSILSDTAKLFDPIGYICPVIVKAKIFMQRLWIGKLDWDQPLNNEDQLFWHNYRAQLMNLNKIKIKRFNGRILNAKTIELHGFADASSEAYGACIYLKVIDMNDKVTVRLLAAKLRVAPIKQQTIPRLELCAALVLVRLMMVVSIALEMENTKKYYWSDATIVLYWIKTESSKLKVFVGNRIAEIQDSSDVENWNHVSSQENPADILSRGTDADELKTLELWWNGPVFLQSPNAMVNSSYLPLHLDELPEQKPIKTTLTIQKTQEKSFIQDFIERFSNLLKLKRITAIIFRFYFNCKNTQSRISGTLTVDEIRNGMYRLCMLIQQESFAEEYRLLSKKQQVQNNSSLKLLNPFMDQNQLVRVGGRLSQSSLSFEQKHQILLPQKSHITSLIVIHEHQRHLHSGQQATLSAVRQLYWPVNGKVAVKCIIRKCVKCFRAKPVCSEQMMSDLPATRVNQNQPFTTCGVDYCGPFMIRNKNQRGGSNVKAYIAVFVCFAIKAVHLEVVGDLSTASFRAALNRLISRRGMIRQINSDNATNFVGTHNEIEEFKKFIRNSSFEKDIKQFCLDNQIEWKFISPYSPSKGGIWESAVKSAKHHMKRTVVSSLTFEELTTLATQIEGILNSRPLTPLSTDPEDLNALTPAHLLIGNPITFQPQYDLVDVNINRLDRWQQIQHMQQGIWKRWHKDYLNELQQRKKWNKERPNLKTGDMVVLKDDNLPPTLWLLGRITEVHQGSDNKVRNVLIKTKNGVTSRGISKVCLLPIDDNTSSD